ncbi:hypothetical protein BDW22DRAFT_1349194 [Trametopsis cervina]|nr:hypothetical protein BDW22DRAFT_1349194 [Trametopsis cervina]
MSVSLVSDGQKRSKSLCTGVHFRNIAHFVRRQIAVYLEVAASTLFFYDYLLTLPQEIKCVWQRPKHGAAVLFFVNRYVVFFNRLIRLVQTVSWSGETENNADVICNVVWRVSEGCTIIMYLLVAVFATLRMYAVWGKDMKIGGCILILGLVYPLVNTYFVTTLSLSALAPPFTGCGQQTTLNFPSADLLFFLFGTVFAILFECVIIALTWTKTLDIQRVLRRKSMGAHRSTSYLILRDGTTYFLTLLSFNILSLLSIRVEFPHKLTRVSLQAFNNVPAITDTLTSMLITRFILNLREDFMAAQDGSSSSLHPSNMSDLRFAARRSTRLIGNLGAPVYVDDYNASLSEGEDDPLTAVSVSNHPLHTGLLMRSQTW